ncbi:MAG: hypothetical protein ACYDC6_13255, partial [Acidobacteriaceae bacterium]
MSGMSADYNTGWEFSKTESFADLIDPAQLEWADFPPPWPQTTRPGWGTRMAHFKCPNDRDGPLVDSGYYQR